MSDTLLPRCLFKYNYIHPISEAKNTIYISLFSRNAITIHTKPYAIGKFLRNCELKLHAFILSLHRSKSNNFILLINDIKNIQLTLNFQYTSFMQKIFEFMIVFNASATRFIFSCKFRKLQNLFLHL